MKMRVVSFLVGVSICYGCGNSESASSSNESISGTYVREYSSEILNQLSGNKMGMRTVRDTIYISTAGEKFKVENAKWSMNDYDQEGWKNMEHAESGPLPAFTAEYDESSRTLNSGSAPDLVISEDNKLSVGGKSEIAYAKIN
ncbi:hypothetical protein [Pseudochryseolinea flava]|uniref:Uncharacterized protein n=1 Tax=Pseudochryseolinea flava TaxID=2059302 RepID=A0A364Y528_9BACT|nr:hypothetical protein [Pseudochryseolinea flava]RAW01969.1 hypothetical protein DQQ10_05265 [Pseudochryseolinea flava]